MFMGHRRRKHPGAGWLREVRAENVDAHVHSEFTESHKTAEYNKAFAEASRLCDQGLAADQIRREVNRPPEIRYPRDHRGLSEIEEANNLIEEAKHDIRRQ